MFVLSVYVSNVWLSSCSVCVDVWCVIIFLSSSICPPPHLPPYVWTSYSICQTGNISFGLSLCYTSLDWTYNVPEHIDLTCLSFPSLLSSPCFLVNYNSTESQKLYQCSYTDQMKQILTPLFRTGSLMAAQPQEADVRMTSYRAHF